MAATKIIPLLLAGGAGTRLWPVSRDAMPKQFLPLVGERSTYQQALARVSEPGMFAPPIVMTASDLRFFARTQAEEIGIDATIVLEPIVGTPVRRSPLAHFLRFSGIRSAIVLALAADHVIFDDPLFHAACAAACEIAAGGYIVAFGIPPIDAENQLRLYPPRSAARARRMLCGRRLCREAGCGNGGALCLGGLFMELGKFPIPSRYPAF